MVAATTVRPVAVHAPVSLVFLARVVGLNVLEVQRMHVTLMVAATMVRPAAVHAPVNLVFSARTVLLSARVAQHLRAMEMGRVLTGTVR